MSGMQQHFGSLLKEGTDEVSAGWFLCRRVLVGMKGVQNHVLC